MNKKIMAIALCACSVNFALAESVEPKAPSKARAVTGLVLGVQAGFASGFNPPDTRNVSGTNYSVSTTSGGFNFGGLVGYDVAINDRFSVGVEVDINYTPDIYKESANFGGISGDDSLNLLNIPIMATAKFVAPFGLNVFAKGGLNYQYADVSSSCSGVPGCGTQTASNSAWTGVLAAGVGYQINTINIFAQYMYIFGKDLQNLQDNKAVEQGILTGGVSYTLPM
ncbi:porin family protein [Francisellaceae bacterium]|nr:porin family protein [Francisellaceae bacterium]